MKRDYVGELLWIVNPDNFNRNRPHHNKGKAIFVSQQAFCRCLALLWKHTKDCLCADCLYGKSDKGGKLTVVESEV